MHFIQKALLYNRVEFHFEEKKLAFIIDDGCLKVGFTSPYHEISARHSIKSFPEKAFFHYALSLITAAAAANAFTEGEVWIFYPYALLTVVIIGLVLLLLSRHMRFEATRIPVASGHTILVFHGLHHQTILHEINKRRKSEMLRLYAEVDVLNDPKLELKKFLWLKEENIFSKDEFEDARLKIAALSKNQSKHS